MLSNSIFRKFIEVISLKNWQVLSENNTWNNIVSINKTVKYCIWNVEFSDGRILRCADNHILIDINGREVFARDCICNIFKDSNQKIISVKAVHSEDIYENMYDLSLAEDTNHLYYTNGILSHNSTTYCIYLLWFLIFNPEKKVLIAANKKTTALEILGKVQLAYEMLPNWIKPGLSTYNKSEMVFGNLSSIRAEATSSDAARGVSCNILVLDEFAFAEQPEKFWASVYPIVSSDINGKVLIVSTPNGVGNLFYNLWEKANSGGKDNIEGWVPFRVDWWEVPDHDEKWKQQQIASLGSVEIFNQEFGNQFLSSTFKKLISDDIIMNFRKKISTYNIKEDEVLVNPDDINCKFTYIQYHKFDPRKTYIASGDSSEGTGGDDSVLYIFDITQFNDIKMCAKFSRNDISTTEFAYVIYNILRQYYNPYLAIERNTTGTAVLDALCSTVYNYENVVVLNKHGRPGIMSHMQIKQKACMWIRELLSIEDFNIEIYDKQLIDEMDTFIKKDTAQHVVYAAMLKKHDDHIMSFIWAMYILTNDLLQKYYNILNWTNTSIGKSIPGTITPLLPYDINENLYRELIKNNKENINVPLLQQSIKNNIKNRIDRFFGDEENEEEQFYDNAISHFNDIKTVEQYDEYHQQKLEEEIENNMFYRNMIY